MEDKKYIVVYVAIKQGTKDEVDVKKSGFYIKGEADTLLNKERKGLGKVFDVREEERILFDKHPDKAAAKVLENHRNEVKEEFGTKLLQNIEEQAAKRSVDGAELADPQSTSKEEKNNVEIAQPIPESKDIKSEPTAQAAGSAQSDAEKAHGTLLGAQWKNEGRGQTGKDEQAKKFEHSFTHKSQPKQQGETAKGASPKYQERIQPKSQLDDRVLSELSQRVREIEKTLRILNKNYTDSVVINRPKMTRELQKMLDDAVSNLATKQKMDNLMEDMSHSLDDIKDSIQSSFSPLETVPKKMTEVLDCLSQKGISIQKEAIPVNSDSKTVANAQKLAKRLIDDLASAATEYAKNRSTIDDAAYLEDRIKSEAGEKIEKARSHAKTELIQEILEKYDDIEGFISDDNNSIIVNIMKKYGLHIDEEMQPGKDVNVADGETEKYLSRATGITSAGRYTVKKSLIWLGDTVIQRATLEKIGD